MARRKIPENQRLVTQGVRISPRAKRRFERFSREQKRLLIAQIRAAVEAVILNTGALSQSVSGDVQAVE